MKIDTNNKVALVTGASRGIGKAIAIELGDKGIDVIVNYVRNKEDAEIVVNELTQMGRRAFAIQADLTDPVAVEDLQREIRRLRDQHQIAMLITDHNVHRTLEIVDRGYIITEGKVFFAGTPREIITNEQVKKLYLGSTFRGDEFDQ